MSRPRRLGLILPPSADPWRRYNLEQGFVALACQAASAGWQVEMFAAEAQAFQPPAGILMVPVVASGGLLGSAASAATTMSLQFGHLAWRMVRDRGFDILMAPLAQGVLQPSLMSRAAGESLTRTSMLIWGDTPTATRLRHDPIDNPLAGLVDDALERACLRLADRVIAPSDAVLSGFLPLGLAPDRRRIGVLPVGTGISPSVSEEFVCPLDASARDLIFVGPGNSRYGADKFLLAVERAAMLGRLSARKVILAGPWRERAYGLSKQMVGIRAQHWSFAFEMADGLSPDAILAMAKETNAVAVFAGNAADDDVLVERFVRSGVSIALSPDHRLAERLKDTVAATEWDTTIVGFVDRRSVSRGPVDDDWPAILAEAWPAGSASPASPRGKVSVCITHRDRPAELASAVASVDGVAEVVVADVGSQTAAALGMLATLEAAGTVVLRLDAIEQGIACDAAAARATGEILVFLDDDNLFIEDGCSRLANALASGTLDIVVANLTFSDPSTKGGGPAAELAFLGDAGSAGLFFNGLGDKSFAIKKSVFNTLGGFGAYDGAGIDWVFLSRARSAGFVIGVLQHPAISYRRDVDAVRTRWRKNDREGVRRAVLDVSEGAFDASLVAIMAQARCEESDFP